MTISTFEDTPTYDSNSGNWDYESCEQWLIEHDWTLEAMDILLTRLDDEGNILEEDGYEVLLELAEDFWVNTQNICPRAESLVALATHDCFFDRFAFFEEGTTWITTTSKSFQTDFLWEFWENNSPSDLTSLSAQLVESSDSFVSALAAMFQVNELILTEFPGHSAPHNARIGGVDILRFNHWFTTAYKSLTSDGFLTRLKESRKFGKPLVETIQRIESVVLTWNCLTEEQNKHLTQLLREAGF